MSTRTKPVTTRRRFLKTTATVAAASAVVGAATNTAFPSVVPEKMVFDQNHSHWSRALPSVSSVLARDTETNVAVIGGGLTGLSAAYNLKKNRPSDRVVILEAVRCGNGASGRNGAMLLTSTEDRYMSWSGDPELDKRIYELTSENARNLQRLCYEFSVDAEIELSGALQMCNTEKIADDAQQFLGKAKSAGFPYEYWDRQKIASVVGTSAYPGALFDPNSGQLHPGKLIRLFKKAAESVGVEIYEATPIVSIDEGEIITLVTANGNWIRTRSTILATNAYSSKLGYLRQGVTPVFDYVGMTRPLSEARISEIGWKKRIPFNDSRTEVFYLGLTKDNRVHIGGGQVDYVFNNGLREPKESSRRFEELRTELGRILPALAEEPFETTWSGAVDMSLDQTPSVGQTGKHGNIFYAVGFSGHGVNLTSVFGRILADSVHGRGSDWTWLPYFNRPPLYTPNEPFRWIGTQAALAYYRLTDPKRP